MTSKKDLSRELCEICVIERKGKLIFKKRDWDKKTYICSGHGYKEFDFKSIPEAAVDIVPTKDYKETNGFLYPYSDIERIKEEYDKNGYDFVEFRQRTINFEQPENFVKLLKIANDVLGSVHFTTAYTKNKPHIFEEQVLLHYLPIAKLNEAFKQAIREMEWVYE